MLAAHSNPMDPPTAEPLFVTLGSGRKINKGSLFHVLQTGGWAGLYAVCTFAAAQNMRFWPAVLDTFVWAIWGFVVTSAVHHVYRRSRRLHHSYFVFAALALGSSVVLAPVWYFMEQISSRATVDAVLQFDSLRPTFAAYAVRVARDPLFYSIYLWPFYSIILLTWASLYFGVNAMLELESERAAVVNALKLADTARLRAMQSNLNPHFLFNALNSIATLVREQDSTTAGAMIDALSIFLRSTLQRLDTPELRVAEELELIEQYLRIQRYRFGTRLQAQVEVMPDTLDALIPTLILQPLVENAVRHGVLPREAGGSLWVRVHRELAALVVSVEDDGPGLNAGVFNAFGVGLQNSSDRLKALYGTSGALTINTRTKGTGCAVVITIPFHLSPAGQTRDEELEDAQA